MSQGHLIHLVEYFDDRFQFLELFPSFGRRNSGMILLFEVLAW